MKRSFCLVLALVRCSPAAGMWSLRPLRPRLSSNSPTTSAAASRLQKNPRASLPSSAALPTSGASPGGKDSLVAAADDSWTSFDLGLSDSVANLGAVKEPSLETLLAAEPDLVLASCNTAADLELKDVLEDAGITTAYFDIQSLDDYLNMLGICTQLTDCPENYETYGSAAPRAGRRSHRTAGRLRAHRHLHARHGR